MTLSMKVEACRYRNMRLSAFASSEWPKRVVSASSDFSGADAQIRNADYHFIKLPVAGLAEEQSVPKAILIVESWPTWNLSTMLQNTAKPVPIYQALRNCVTPLGPHPPRPRRAEQVLSACRWMRAS
jgi:hypothetical protein